MCSRLARRDAEEGGVEPVDVVEEAGLDAGQSRSAAAIALRPSSSSRQNASAWPPRETAADADDGNRAPSSDEAGVGTAAGSSRRRREKPAKAATVGYSTERRPSSSPANRSSIAPIKATALQSRGRRRQTVSGDHVPAGIQRGRQDLATGAAPRRPAVARAAWLAPVRASHAAMLSRLRRKAWAAGVPLDLAAGGLGSPPRAEGRSRRAHVVTVRHRWRMPPSAGPSPCDRSTSATRTSRSVSGPSTPEGRPARPAQLRALRPHRHLDVLRIVVAAAHDDEVLEAAGDKQLAVAEEAEVAGAQERPSAAPPASRARNVVSVSSGLPQ